MTLRQSETTEADRLSELIIWGASGHAKVVADIFRKMDGLRIAGFLDDRDPSRRGEVFCESKVLGGAEELERLWSNGVRHAFVAFGDNARRMEVGALLEARGFRLLLAVHPSATVATDVKLGDGTMIAAGAVVNSATTVGRNVIINTQAGVDHDCVVEDGAQISPGANVAGGVRIGSLASIGIGATIIEKITIGAKSVVGAGAVVISDVPESVLVLGVPARVKKHLLQNHD